MPGEQLFTAWFTSTDRLDHAVTDEEFHDHRPEPEAVCGAVILLGRGRTRPLLGPKPPVEDRPGPPPGPSRRRYTGQLPPPGPIARWVPSSPESPPVPRPPRQPPCTHPPVAVVDGSTAATGRAA